MCTTCFLKNSATHSSKEEENSRIAQLLPSKTQSSVKGHLTTGNQESKF